MQKGNTEELLKLHLPEKALAYCINLWKKYPFRLVLKPSRSTRVGDFCFKSGKDPIITLNNDLHPYLFLVTYIHEFSHHAVRMVYGNKTMPHGKEWKLAFKTFMEPVMNMDIFPPDLNTQLSEHLQNPRASSFTDQKLTALFRKYDEQWAGKILVLHLPDGGTFQMKRRFFKKGKRRRTRFECRELKTGKLYLVPADLPVDHWEEDSRIRIT